jgi:hypothetical protein
MRMRGAMRTRRRASPRPTHTFFSSPFVTHLASVSCGHARCMRGGAHACSLRAMRVEGAEVCEVKAGGRSCLQRPRSTAGRRRPACRLLAVGLCRRRGRGLGWARRRRRARRRRPAQQHEQVERGRAQRRRGAGGVGGRAAGRRREARAPRRRLGRQRRRRERERRRRWRRRGGSTPAAPAAAPGRRSCASWWAAPGAPLAVGPNSAQANPIARGCATPAYTQAGARSTPWPHAASTPSRSARAHMRAAQRRRPTTPEGPTSRSPYEWM